MDRRTSAERDPMSLYSNPAHARFVEVGYRNQVMAGSRLLSAYN